MSVIEFPDRRLINTDTYQASLTATKRLLDKEIIPIPARRQMIFDLLDLVYRGDENDQKAKDEAARLTIHLFLSDPLTDQQAGAIARCLHSIRNLDLWPFLPENGHHLHLGQDEMVEIMAGDWEKVNQIFMKFQERAKLWRESLGKIETSEKPRKVYRMLELHPDDVASISQLGMIPEGFHRFTDLKSLVAAQQDSYFGHSYLPYPSGIEWLAEHLYFSKANLLIENWEEWKTGNFSPFKLGLGATTARNIHHRGSAYHGKYIFEIVLTANRLIAAPRDGLPEDERTILYYIEPEAVKAVYEIEPISPLTPWEQMLRQKLKPSSLIARFFGQ